MPKSPKVICVPPLARPVRLGWCCLRCLVRRGMSMAQASVSGAAAGAASVVVGALDASAAPVAGCSVLACSAGGWGRRTRPPRSSPPRPPRPPPPAAGGAAAPGSAVASARPRTATAGSGLGGVALRLGLVALVDPALHSDPTEGGAGLEEPEVHVGAQRVQRHSPFAVELGTAHLRPAEPAGDLDPDTLGAGPLSGLHALTHGPPEGDSRGELFSDALGHQLGVQFGVLDFQDVQLHLLTGELLQLTAQAVGFGTAAPDHDARPRGVQVHLHPVPGTHDADLRDSGPLQAGGHQLADLDVLLDVVPVPLALGGAIGEPPRPMVGGDPETEPCGVDLLAHQRAPPLV